MHDFTVYSKKKRSLLRSTQRLPRQAQTNIQRAIALAEQYHAGQTRGIADDEQAGYVIHCVRVASWLTRQGVRDSHIIIAALLHDTLEDTHLSARQIKKEFGADVLRLVRGLTRPRPSRETERHKLAAKPRYFRHVLRAPTRIRLIKTADMLDNMRGWPMTPRRHPLRKKFPRWLNEAEKYYIPIAQSVDPAAAREMVRIVRQLQARD